jgi:hypothetical protein
MSHPMRHTSTAFLRQISRRMDGKMGGRVTAHIKDRPWMTWLNTHYPTLPTTASFSVQYCLRRPAHPIHSSTHSRFFTTSNMTKLDWTYPTVRRDETVKEELHGHIIADPYRWLEDPESEETKASIHSSILDLY